MKIVFPLTNGHCNIRVTIRWLSLSLSFSLSCERAHAREMYTRARHYRALLHVITWRVLLSGLSEVIVLFHVAVIYRSSSGIVRILTRFFPILDDDLSVFIFLPTKAV